MSNNHFLDLKFSSDDVFSILKSINSNKALGPEGIHGKAVKNCARGLAYPLSVLFNLSFVTGLIHLTGSWHLWFQFPKRETKIMLKTTSPFPLLHL